MASLAESSLGSVPIDDIRAAQQRLNNYKQPNHDTQRDSGEPGQQGADSDNDATTTAIANETHDKAPSVPESIEPSTRVPIDSLPRTRNMMLNVSRTAPREMLTWLGGERLAIPKAVSFSQYEGGDTQPWDSQDVVESSKSMIALGQMTPQRARAGSDSTPNTYNSGLDTDQSIPIVLGIDNMSPPTSQARRDFMENDTQMPDLSREETSPTTSQVERDILRDETQPRTQLGMRDVPATPAMAGNKHSRDGEILTSAATIKTPHNLTQWFGGGERPPVMSNTQLFGVADSSPAMAPPQAVAHSDPIQSRPSPNINGSATLSSPPFTSPIMHMQPGPASSRAPGDPMTRYRPMAESQQEARERLRRKRGGGFEEDENLDESPEFRTIRGQSTADGLSNFKAPLRPGSRPGSSSKVIDLSDTIKTPITERRWNQFVDLAAGEEPAADEEEEQLPETQDLPLEPDVEYSERDEPPEPDVEYSERDEPPEPDTNEDQAYDGADTEREGNVKDEDNDGNDEYDEFGQTLRSQSQFELQYEEDALVDGYLSSSSGGYSPLSQLLDDDDDGGGSPVSRAWSPVGLFADPSSAAAPAYLDVAINLPRRPFPVLAPGAPKIPASAVEEPTVPGMWWSAGVVRDNDKSRSAHRHIVRIMETTLGEYLEPENACSACVAAGAECWRYNATGKKTIAHAGSQCARCRFSDKRCSIFTRRRTRKKPAPVDLPKKASPVLLPKPAVPVLLEHLAPKPANPHPIHRNTLESGREGARRSTQSTQVSAIADSQPTAQQSEPRPTNQQAVQYSSYIPGSQHQGKTSEEMALLYTPRASNQSRVLASQLQVEESDETDITGVKIPSSPPIALPDEETIPEDSAGASIVRRDLLEQFQSDAGRAESNEIPESDLHEGSAHQEESVPLYSTARTHVSGSGQSPAKPSSGTSPRKAHGSQRSRVIDQSPAVPRFADVNAHATPSLVTDNSFGNDLSQNVRDMVDGVWTAEDQMVHELVFDDSSALHRRKRAKRSYPVRSSRRGSSSKRDNVEAIPEHDAEIPAVQGSRASDKVDLIAESSEETRRSESEPTLLEKEGEEQATSHEQRDTPPPALMDTLNKANQMPTVLADDEGEKTRETTTESVRMREEAGRAAVSQLIATRKGVTGKRSKQATYAGRSRRKLSRTDSTAAGRLRRLRAPATIESDHDEEESIVAEAEDKATGADQGHDEGATHTDEPISTIEHCPAVAESSEADVHGDTALDDVEGPAESIGTDVVAGDRIWAVFRGTPQCSYTATWLGASPDGTSYKIKFDDQTVTNILYYHVRRLELRIGDIVKVDEPAKRKRNWVVVGFGPVATTDAERALGADIFGHISVNVQQKRNRESLSKSTSSNIDDDEIYTIPINYLYLTLAMWPHYNDRAFEPPTKASSDRPETPGSGGTSAAATPGSRPCRASGPSGKGKASRSSHLREISVALTSSASPTAMFSGMAFAISYFAAGEEKAVVTELIQRNGGIVLKDGFEELFDLPDISTTEVLTPSKKSPGKKDDTHQAAGLQLNAKYKHLKFAALIADRHSRRAKYMQALALGLPTVSGRWIVHSLDENKNPGSGSGGPLAWDRYLLPAGESTFLNAIRSRNLTPYDANSASLAQTIAKRACLLNAEGLILVAPKTGSVNWEKRKTFAFLTMACGAGPVQRVHDVHDTKKLMLSEPEVWKWVYIDTSVTEAEKVLFGRGVGGTSAVMTVGKKRKRGAAAAGEVVGGSAGGEEKMSAMAGGVKIVNDEFVIQSLILEALVE